MSEIKIDSFDSWLRDDGPAALVFRRALKPAEEDSAWIFPPTFARSETEAEDDEETGGQYQIDPLPDDPRRNVCTIDSIGSQANRMEPVFKTKPYSDLVPQHEVTMRNGETVNLLDVGHRAADAAFRFSKKHGPQLWEAFNHIKKARDYSKLVKLAPTSLVFGVWDSRATGIKIQRIVRSVIRAYDVTEARRSATYQAAYDYTDGGNDDDRLIRQEFDKGAGKNNPLSQEGFKYSLASNTHGGVLVKQGIRQEAMVNLVALRTLNIDMNWKRYLLGLALTALTYRDQHCFNLREGCLLRPKSEEDREGKWWGADFYGKDTPVSISHDQALGYTQVAVKNVEYQEVEADEFDKETANEWLKLPKKKRKSLAKQKHPAAALADEKAKARKKNSKKKATSNKSTSKAK